MPKLQTETIGAGKQSWLGSLHALEDAISGAPDTSLFTTATYPDGIVPSGTPLGQLTAGLKVGPYTGDSTDEVQTIALTGSPSGGTFVASPFALGATAPWAIADTAAQIQAKVDAVPALVGKVKVGGTAGAWTLTAIGAAANQDLSATVISSKNLTGGSSPDVTVTTNTAGGADASADGREVLHGFLATDQKVGGDGAWPIVWHGRIKVNRLPIPFATTGHVTTGQFTFTKEV